MTDKTFEDHMREMLGVIDTLPEAQRVQLRDIFEETRTRHEAIKEASARSKEAVDNWRLICKYMVFDFEARLREAGVPRRDNRRPEIE